MSKTEDLHLKIRYIRVDMQNYLQDFLLPLLSGRNFEESNFHILFRSLDCDHPELLHFHSINEDADLIFKFEYDDGTEQNEDVPLEALRFDALFQIIEFLEQFISE